MRSWVRRKQFEARLQASELLLMLMGPEAATSSPNGHRAAPTTRSPVRSRNKVRPAELLDLMGVEIEGLDPTEGSTANEE